MPHTGLTGSGNQDADPVGSQASEGHRGPVQTQRTANIHSSENEGSDHPKTMLSNALQSVWARAAGPHPQSAFLPSEKREVLCRAWPEVPGLHHSSRQQHAQRTVSPGHSRDPRGLTLRSHMLCGLPQHHTHCLSAAPSSETLPHQPSFPVGPWRVSLSACRPHLTSLTPPGPHYAQISGLLHSGPAQPEGLAVCLRLLNQALDQRFRKNTTVPGLRIKAMCGACPEKQGATLGRVCAPDESWPGYPCASSCCLAPKQ